MGILIGIIALGLLVFIHELGHFCAARFFDIKVDEFSIGMGPKLFGFQKGETLYAIRLVPFGGYVKMEGEESASEDGRAFCNKSAWQRFVVVFAGAFMNMLLGLILMIGLVASSENLPNMTIVGFGENAVSNSCGLKIGDKVLKIGEHALKVRRDFNHILAEIAEKPVDILVQRNSRVLLLKDVKFPVIEDKETGFKLPVLDFEIGTKDKTVFGVVKYSFDSIYSDVKTVWFSLKGLVTGKYSLKMMAGPVQVVEVMGNAVKSTGGLRSLLSFVVLITVNLGVLNLLPLPALDGGRILFLLIEMIRRKPINQKWEEYINTIGFVLLMIFSVFVFYNDIAKLVTRLKINFF